MQGLTGTESSEKLQFNWYLVALVFSVCCVGVSFAVFLEEG